MDPLANPVEELVDEAGNPPDWIWRSVGAGAGIVGAVLARKVLDTARARVSPLSAAEQKKGQMRTGWVSGVVWAAIVGVAASLGRVLAQRMVAKIWAKRAAAAPS